MSAPGWLGMLLLTASQALAAPTETPALLVRPDAAARDQLRAAVSRVLKAPSLTLADDALLRNSVMVIEKVRPRDARGIQLDGRDRDKPEPFRLLKVDDVCVLVRLRTGQRIALPASHCMPADD
ncbi:hypothetical protein AAKU55_000706 [Oxalobacteraceae bacterium GrIS 1.11]